jgi:TPR repeat protein
MVAALVRRGEALLAIGDISGARRFFERAAQSGSAAAALAMGGTFDPRVLAQLGARGIAPDRAAARTWYQRAAALGEAEAAARISALDSSP